MEVNYLVYHITVSYSYLLIQYIDTINVPFCRNYIMYDRLFGIVVSASDYHPRGHGFDSRLYPRNFSGSIGSGTGSTQPREDKWVAT